MSDMTPRRATAEDLPAVVAGLRALALDLDDPFNATSETLHSVLFGADAHSIALIAGGGTRPRGVALISPFMSTVLGHACIYVSDLWVAKDMRGHALGRRLLQAAAREGAACWKARALYLNVYERSGESMAFYRHLGFEISTTDRRASLKGGALDRLMAMEGVT